MGDRKRKLAKEASANIHMTKKCPECFAYLPLVVKVCTSCGKAVGPVNKLGHAEKLPDVKGYLTAAAAILAFIIFVWWGFFTEP
ncbi:MAG: hypothetical protein Q7U75_10095 [Desulfobacterales bacterium]|nr:hypothetical protein [Desulfobacterales bacterium]